MHNDQRIGKYMEIRMAAYNVSDKCFLIWQYQFWLRRENYVNATPGDTWFQDIRSHVGSAPMWANFMQCVIIDVGYDYELSHNLELVSQDILMCSGKISKQRQKQSFVFCGIYAVIF